VTKKGENIYKRKDSRWEGRYIKGRTSENKIIYGSVYGKTYSETKQKLIVLKAKHIEPVQKINPYAGTFSEWLSFWFTSKVKNEVKPTTYSSYYRMIKKYILPFLGDYELKKMTISVIQNFVVSLQEQGLSPRTIYNIFSILKKCLNAAKVQGFIAENPCYSATLPKSIKKEIRVLTVQQQRKLEVAALKEEWCSPIILSLYSGLRVGEISGLKWSDIDFQNNLIQVRRTVSRIVAENSYDAKTKLIEGSPKSKHSNREIPLAKNLKEYLKQYSQRTSSIYVVSKTCSITEPRIITYRFKKTLKEAGLPDTNFHVLRHTFATRCIEKGVDIVSLSKILGHQSTKMTLDTYTGSLLETRRMAMTKLDRMFNHSF
jgi:integrase